jgi:general L-amino acid transport system permease protein
LGRAQLICRDGSVSARCAYDFMSSEAGFDISDTLLPYTNTDSYWYAFYLGLLNTLRVGLLGVVFTTMLGTFAGVARLSENWLISKLALWYVELIRNTPLLVQLFFIYFGVILALPNIQEAAQPLGLPLFLSNRGLNIPWAKLTSSASIWMAFLVLGIIQFQVLWILLGRREERTGHASNRLGAGLVSFLIVAGIGWVISTSVSDTQGLMTPARLRIFQIDDIEQLMLNRTGLNFLDQLETLSEEEIEEAALRVCVLRDSASEPNLTNQLRSMGIPYDVRRVDRPSQATSAYVEGDCEVFAASKSILASERSTLESPGGHNIVSIRETPLVWTVPVREGFNIAGGIRMSPEFTALLFGLVIFYGGSLAEIVRAGILSVGKGQSETARALGLSDGQRLQLIVLPQALRVVIPPLIGIYLSLIKDTSLGIALGFPDMYQVSNTTINQSGRAVQLIILMMIIYLIISLIFSGLLNWYNDRIAIVER